MECKLCDSKNVTNFLNLGKMPVANAYVRPEDAGKEEFKFNLGLNFCGDCKMVQLKETVPYDQYIVPDEEGKTHYAFFSGTSDFMKKHFRSFAQTLEQRFLTGGNKRVLEIGSNDGIMLSGFSDISSVLGVEPSWNVAEVAKGDGIETVVEFFTEDLAKRIERDKGRFRVVSSANVLLNIYDLDEVMRGADTLLDDKGVFVTEDPYIGEIVEKTAYDQIYDEHAWYFSLTSLDNLYKRHGFEIFDAERQWTHGGSMRVYAGRIGEYEKTEGFEAALQDEKRQGLHTIEPYMEFANSVHQSKFALAGLLESLRADGKKIVGYAAASKGTIVQNYCGITPEMITYVSDNTSFKQGLLTPGMHIPIVSPEMFHSDKDADYALLFAWNHADEIIAKEKDFIDRGGRFIVHIPEARIVP